MSFANFQTRVSAIVAAAGMSKDDVSFHTDEESGRHFARFTDGTTIIGNRSCARVSVHWGSGHKALADI